MTNKEIAAGVANIVFTQKDGGPSCDAFALQLLLETLNDPTKYTNESVGYLKKDLEKAIMDLLSPLRINGMHYMDLSERMGEKSNVQLHQGNAQ